MSVLNSFFQSSLFNHPRWRRYTALIHEDLNLTYSRDIQKWLLLAPIIGIITGLAISLLTIIVLGILWARILPFYLSHHWAIIPGLLAGFILTGLIMRFLTSNPDQHSTEEIIASYHENQGDIDMRSFFWKMLASVTTVGSGGSAALEGPSIYGGGAIGSWLWLKLRRFGLEPEDRRLMLICGAAAGMAAVFKAPLTGIVFALEMPYKDDFVHAALLPALIASVISYSTLAALIGGEPVFGFVGSISFAPIDLVWAAVLGIACGLIAMAFTITFRRFRGFMVNLAVPHVTKLAAGGLLTGICGLAFITAFPGNLIPIGPNYEAVRLVLTRPHSSTQLVWFAVIKLAATLFSLGSGGVSAMFVPLFLVGGAFGSAFAQTIAHSPSFDLYAAVGMASFLAAGYKAPLTAVVFVAETTGGHSFIIPSLIGAACAYAISGESSASADQRLHQVVKFNGRMGVSVREVMRREVVSVQASASLYDFAHSVSAHHRHTVFPVYDGDSAVGTMSVWVLSDIRPEQWNQVTVGEVCDRATSRVAASCDLLEALRLLLQRDSQPMLLVGPPDGVLEGIVTRTDILRSLQHESTPVSHHRREDAE